MSEDIAGTNLGSDRANRLVPLARPRRFFEWDYFWTGRGNLVQSQIGRLGWSLNGSAGTASFQRLAANLSSSAKLRVSTGVLATQRATLALGSTEATQVTSTKEIYLHQAVIDMNGSLATKNFFFGGIASMATDPTTVSSASVGIGYNSDISPNFLSIFRFGTAESFLLPSQVPVPASTPVLLTIYQPRPFHFEFYASEQHGSFFESVLLGTYDAQSSSAARYNIGFRLQTLADSQASVNLGYWGMTSNRIDAVYSSDDFIDAMKIRA